MGLFSRFRRDSATSAPPAADHDDATPDDTAPPADIVALTDQTFMAGTEGGLTVVDFWAGWCQPCRQFAPTFETAARRHSDRMRFAKVDVDRERGVAGLVGVQSIPTVVVFGDDGSEITRASGLLSPTQLESLLARAVAQGSDR